MTAAIFYNPEGYTTTGPKLMGRNAAGESFLRGFLQYTSGAEFWIEVQDPAHAQVFTETARKLNRGEPIRVITAEQRAALSQPGALYLPGPNIADDAWRRAVFGHESWSLCGITHTTSSAIAMDAIASLVAGPVQPWDALICTSAAVKDNVLRVLQAQIDYLKSRLGVTKIVMPQLPVIPLGIHTGDFAYTDAQKRAARARLGAEPDTLIVLYTGRLSFHAKAHPLAMYQALQEAATRTGKSVLLVECGWHANDYIARAFADAAQAACPSVRVITLDGRKGENRDTAWASADVFCSLSDNIQETFGIVPIEAMAAGLPVVVSDWDGYRDTVRAGIDGFRIPTIMPGAGLAGDLASRHALGIDTYDMYCGNTCMLVSVDVTATAAAFVELFQSPELRQRMGAAGRERARTVFDWRTIIPQYETLWAQLAELRGKQSSSQQKLPHPWPARMDPFYAFATYPTKVLQPDTRLRLADANFQLSLARIRRYRQLAAVNFAATVLPSDAEVAMVLQAAETPQPAAELLKGIPRERQAHVFRGLAWLVKMHVLQIVVP